MSLNQLLHLTITLTLSPCPTRSLSTTLRWTKKPGDTLSFKFTRGHIYNRYSCTATEDLYSERSDAVQIKYLRWPRTTHFRTKLKLNKYDKFTVKEGEMVGPIFCSADCKPPCNVRWKYKESNGLKDTLSQNGILLLRSVNRNIIQITCSSRWKNESVEKDISLDILMTQLFL